MFVLLKLLGIAAIVAFFGALEMQFGIEVAAVALLHAAAIAAFVLVFRRRRRPDEEPRK